MLSITPPDYKFCPFCGRELTSIIEEGKNRSHCSVNHWTFYPSVAQSSTAIILHKDRVLLVKRKREPYQGSWMFPAGFVEYGEHPQETVVREVFEETGLTVDVVRLIDIFQSDDDPRSPGHLIFFYLTKLKKNLDLTNGDSDENSDLQWFPIDRLPPISWHAHQMIAVKLREFIL